MTEVTEDVEETTETTDAVDTTEEVEEARIPRSRLNAEAKKRKAAEKELSELRQQMEELQSAGLPEVERERKAREKAEKELEQRVQEAVDEAKARAKAERLVLAAASRAGFDDPDDVFRYGDIVDISDIEDADQAERAVKRLAKAKPKLLKGEDKTLPGRVLQNGKPAAAERAGEFGEAQIAEAEQLAGELKRFLK